MLNKKLWCSFLLTLTLCVSTAIAEDITKLDYLSIRESTNAMKNKASPDPASIQYVNPKEGDSDYKVQVGIKLAPDMKKSDSLSNKNWITSYQPSLNLNVARDTLSDKPQKWYSVGIGNTWDIVHNAEERAHTVSTDLQYKHDKEGKVKSAAVSLGYRRARLWGLKFDLTKPMFSEPIYYYNLPELHVGYEETIDAPDQASGDSGEGHTSRIWLTESFKIYPLYKYVSTRFELSYLGEFGKDYSPTGVSEHKDDAWELNKAAVSWYISCDRTAALSWEYVSGEDRRKNKPKDETRSMSLKVHWPASKGEKERCSQS